MVKGNIHQEDIEVIIFDTLNNETLKIYKAKLTKPERDW